MDDEYRFRPGSDFLGHFRLEPPIAGAELIDVTLGVDSRALCTWLAGTDDGFDASPADVAAGHLRPAADPVTVTLQDKEAGVVQVWDIPNPVVGASYRVLPDGHLLAFSGYSAYYEHAQKNALIYNRHGAIVSLDSIGVEVTDVRTTVNGAIWIAHDRVEEGDHWRDDYGLERFSADLELQWRAGEDAQVYAGPMSVLGDDVVFYDNAHDAPYCSATRSWLSHPPDASGWILHDPVRSQWGIVDDAPQNGGDVSSKEIEVTLGWGDCVGEWKPYSKGSIVLPLASALERTQVECDAFSVNVWVGQRWYSLSLNDLFNDSIRTTPPRLPDIASEDRGEPQ